MTNTKQVLQMPPETAAYIAGLIDGEGTVTLARRHRNDRRQLVVSIANTDHALLRFVLEAVGAGKITRKRISAAHHTPSYCYSVANRQALALLRAVHPYLRTYKKTRSRLVLAHYIELTPRNGKYTSELTAKREQFVEEVLSANPSRSFTRQKVR
jgi:hypothetical protein